MRWHFLAQYDFRSMAQSPLFSMTPQLLDQVADLEVGQQPNPDEDRSLSRHPEVGRLEVVHARYCRLLHQPNSYVLIHGCLIYLTWRRIRLQWITFATPARSVRRVWSLWIEMGSLHPRNQKLHSLNIQSSEVLQRHTL